MIKDYHMHPMVVQKPEQFDLFVQKAITEGIEEICITDHMPLLCSSAKDRIPHGKIKEYCAAVRRFAGEYKDDISIKVGIEIDFHPSVRAEIDAVLDAGEFDFVLGSSHLHVIKANEWFQNNVTHNDYAKAMFENTILAVQSGLFDSIAHIDMHRRIFARKDKFPLIDDGYFESLHEKLIDETLDAFVENGVRLELNAHIAELTGCIEDMYPHTFIVERALDKGISFTYGSDAHKPESVGVCLKELRKHKLYKQALATWEEILI